MKTYETIQEVPIQTWHDIHTTGNLELLIVEGTPKPKQLEKLWFQLQDEHRKDFGLSETYQSYLSALKRYGLQLAKVIQSADTISVLQLKQKQKELEGFNRKEKTKLGENIAALEKFMGFRLQFLSVFDYYTYMDLMLKSYKKNG